jgi:glyoxylase-like metal-dependent hydrolase (beta-lactamase superfamily II)
MTRVLVLSSLLGVAGLAFAAAGQPARPTVRMQSLNVSDNLYILSGAGGNSLVLVTDTGVVVVDTKLAGAGQAMLDAIRGLTDLPVTTIINTHSHGDHTGSNGEFPGAVIVAHENTGANMASLDARSRPGRTFTSTLSLFDGIDRIDLHHFGAGHTGGDTVVVFPAKRVAHLGDLFAAKGAPLIDAATGGSGLAYPQTLANAVTALAGVNTIVTGHMPPPPGSPVRGMTNIKDLQEYAEFTRDFVAAVGEAFKAGRSVEEASASLALPDRYKAYSMEQAREAVRILYDELRRGTATDPPPARPR